MSTIVVDGITHVTKPAGTRAKVGDKIVIIQESGSNLSWYRGKVGEVYTVTQDLVYGHVHVDHPGNTDEVHFIYNTDYLVLEPIKEEEKQMKPSITTAGDIYQAIKEQQDLVNKLSQAHDEVLESNMSGLVESLLHKQWEAESKVLEQMINAKYESYNNEVFSLIKKEDKQ